MEEKVLVKGVFAGKIFTTVLWIVSIAFAAICIIAGDTNYDDGLIALGIVGGIVLIITTILVSTALKKRELIVTNKRVIARSAFGYRTDIPMEKVSDVSMHCFGGIGCGSPSIKVRFHFCKNKQEIFDAIASETLKRDRAFLG